jgi:cytochrome c2
MNDERLWRRLSIMKHVSVSGLLYLVFNGLLSMESCASDSADILKGQQLARIACSECHVVESDSESPVPMLNESAPRFDDIANRPGTTENSLKKFIITTHWDGETIPMTMPKPELTKQQVVVLARYVMSLRKH